MTIYPLVNGKVQWKQGKRVDPASALAASPSPEPIKPATGSISSPPSLDTPIPGAVQPAKPVAPSGVGTSEVGIPAAARNVFLAFITDAVLAVAKLFGRKR